MVTRALILGPVQAAALHELRVRAAARPVNMPIVAVQLNSASGKAAHMAHMTAQSVELPVGFLVTFSVETGHPVGACRHMSISVDTAAEGKLPHPAAIWGVAKELGFTGGLTDCKVWLEQLAGHIQAVNLVQSIDWT